MSILRFSRWCLLLSMSLIVIVPPFVGAQLADPLDTWNQRNPFTTAFNHFGVAYGNGTSGGTFVIVGSSGLILSSPDGWRGPRELLRLTLISTLSPSATAFL